MKSFTLFAILFSFECCLTGCAPAIDSPQPSTAIVIETLDTNLPIPFSPVATIISQPSPTVYYPWSTPTPLSPIPEDWASYSTGDFSIRYPAQWKMVQAGEFIGTDGFVRVKKTDLPDVGELLPYCIALANAHSINNYTFGSVPLVRDFFFRTNDFREKFEYKKNCFVLPSDNSSDFLQATLLFQFPDQPTVWEVTADWVTFPMIVNNLGIPTIEANTDEQIKCLSLPSEIAIHQTSFGKFHIIETAIAQQPNATHRCNLYPFTEGNKQHQNQRIAFAEEAKAYPPVLKKDKHIYFTYSNSALVPFIGMPAQVEIWQDQTMLDTLAIPPYTPATDPVLEFEVWRGDWYLQLKGVLFRNGENWNVEMGLDWVDGWHLVDDFPLFLYHRGGQFRVGYLENQDFALPLQYNDVYSERQCCERASLAPYHASNGTAFYALRDGIWWWVTITLAE